MNNKTKQILKKGAKVSQTLLTYNYLDGKKARDYYVRHYDKSVTDAKTILYESRDGQSMTDSPLAMYLYLKQNKDYAAFRHVWVVKDSSKENIKRLLANVPVDLRDGIIWIERNSVSYAKWLLKAKYLVTNSTFQSFVNKKDDQIYINTWHGTPLKYMGYDIPGSKTSLKNVQRNFLMADYILSPNEHTSRIFLDRYKLDGLYEGEVLEGGYPRIDFTVNGDNEGLVEYLLAKGVNIDPAKQVVLYTPTWKGTSINNPSQSMGQIKAELAILREENPDKNILIKVHPYAYNAVKLDEELVQYLIPDELDANKVLSIVDVLITDYSSIFFDYLVTDKPIIFYTWDAELYSSYRGMYFEDSELPGPVISDINVVATLLHDPAAVLANSRIQYEAMKAKIVPYDDGQVTERMMAQIFDAQISDDIKVYAPKTQKEKIMIYPGGMQNNGITSSAINLSNQINYDKYDVTFLLWDSNSAEVVANVERLNEKARLIYRFGPKAFTLQDLSKDQYVTRNGISSKNDPKMPKKGYQREANRLFNSTHFDTLVDFSGYSFNGLKLFTVMDAKNVVVYQHNDLKLDSQKVINGEQVHARNLKAIFTLYQLVDHVVSVSDVLAKINGTKLSEYVTPEQMGAIPNLLTTKKTQKVSETNSSYAVNDLQSEGQFTNDTISEFATLADLEAGVSQELPVKVGDKVKLVGEAHVNGRHYYKIAIDFIPRGWVSAKYIDVQANNALQYEEALNRVAWVYRGRRRLFKTPYLNQDQDVISNVKWIDHTFVSVVAKAQTTDGLYYQFVLPDRNEKVWLQASGMLLMQNGRLRLHQRLWNRLINRHSELSHQSNHPQLVQLRHQVEVTSIPKGLDKRNERTRMLKQTGTIYISTEMSETSAGRFLAIKLDGKSWWINEADVAVLNIQVPISNDVEVALNDYLVPKEDHSGVFMKADVLANDFGDLPMTDLSMKLVVDEDEPTNDHYDVYSPVTEMHNQYDLDSIVLLDTFKTGVKYTLKAGAQLLTQDNLEVEVAHERLVQGVLQVLVKTKIGVDQIEWAYVLAEDGETYWVREVDLLAEQADQQQDDIDDNYVMSDNKVTENVDLFADVKPVVPVQHLDTPWITRRIQANVEGHSVDTLIRQNGQVKLLNDQGQEWTLTSDLTLTETPLLQGNGRSWASVNSFTFVAIGRLSPEKNQTMLLDAFARVYSTHPEAELILLGNGVEREKLMAKARQLHIEDAVLFAGQVSNPMDHLQASDVFVHPSLYEGQPMVLLEAMMQDRVIVATNIEANVGVLGNQKYGIVTQGISDEAFADMMLAVIENQYELEKFDIDVYQEEALMRFENIISGKKGE